MRSYIFLFLSLLFPSLLIFFIFYSFFYPFNPDLFIEFSPLEAKEWKRYGFNWEQAAKLQKSNVSLEEAVKWKNNGFSVEETIKYKTKGYDITRARKEKKLLTIVWVVVFLLYFCFLYFFCKFLGW